MLRIPICSRNIISGLALATTLLLAPLTTFAIDISLTGNDSHNALAVPDQGKEVVVFALAFTGVNYRYGGNSPESGMDCSGFVGYVFREAFDVSLPRTSAELEQAGMPVDANELAPGDLVFFNTLGASYSHVGIYLGDDRFIHAPRPGAQIRVENMQLPYWTRRFDGARRIGVS